MPPLLGCIRRSWICPIIIPPLRGCLPDAPGFVFILPPLRGCIRRSWICPIILPSLMGYICRLWIWPIILSPLRGFVSGAWSCYHPSTPTGLHLSFVDLSYHPSTPKGLHLRFVDMSQLLPPLRGFICRSNKITFQELRCPIRRTIIDNNDFYVFFGLIHQRCKRFSNEFNSIVCRQNKSY